MLVSRRPPPPLASLLARSPPPAAVVSLVSSNSRRQLKSEAEKTASPSAADIEVAVRAGLSHWTAFRWHMATTMGKEVVFDDPGLLMTPGVAFHPRSVLEARVVGPEHS